MPEHTIAENLTRLQNAKTAIGSAITAKGGTVATGDGLEEYAVDIATIPSGGIEPARHKDVNFYDFDGTCVYSYTADEFANLSALPANPTHAGLTAQGWNWSLSDAKDYVADYGMLDIGQMYITDDGKTRLYITLTEGRLKPYLGLTGNSAGTAVSIDWGDDSAAEFVTLDTNTVYTPHEYASGGDYVIKIDVTSGSISFNGNVAANSNIFRKSPNPSANSDALYRNILFKMEIGSRVTSINIYGFSYCYALGSVTIPNSITFIASSAFYYSSLKSLTIPNSIASFGSAILYQDSVLSSFIIPNTISRIDDYSCTFCTILRSVVIPNSITSIGNNAFDGCRSLASIMIPNLVTSIDSNAFSRCYGLSFIKFTPTTPPTVSNSNAWTDVPTDCYILVPYDKLDDYLNETNMLDDSVYLYLCFAKYAEGVTLPTEDSDGYTLTWYATKDDARAGVNPITVGNGKEIYAVGV